MFFTLRFFLPRVKHGANQICFICFQRTRLAHTSNHYRLLLLLHPAQKASFKNYAVFKRPGSCSLQPGCICGRFSYTYVILHRYIVIYLLHLSAIHLHLCCILVTLITYFFILICHSFTLMSYTRYPYVILLYTYLPFIYPYVIYLLRLCHGFSYLCPAS